MSVLTKVEFRCKSKLQGIRRTYPDGTVFLEVRCKDHWCADRSEGVVVIHYFDWDTGELRDTKKFKAAKPTRQSGKLDSNQRKVNQ